MTTNPEVKHLPEIIWHEKMGRWCVTPKDKQGQIEAMFFTRQESEATELLRRWKGAPELLEAAKEALFELEPTISDRPGYYANPEQVERLRNVIAKWDGK